MKLNMFQLLILLEKPKIYSCKKEDDKKNKKAKGIKIIIVNNIA